MNTADPNEEKSKGGSSDPSAEQSASRRREENPLTALDDRIVFHTDKEDDFDYRVPEGDDFDWK